MAIRSTMTQGYLTNSHYQHRNHGTHMLDLILWYCYNPREKLNPNAIPYPRQHTQDIKCSGPKDQQASWQTPMGRLQNEPFLPSRHKPITPKKNHLETKTKAKLKTKPPPLIHPVSHHVGSSPPLSPQPKPVHRTAHHHSGCEFRTK